LISREALRERFSQVDIGKWLRLCRGLVIIVATLMIISYVTSYVLNEKVEMIYELEGFEKLTPTTPDFESIMTAWGIRLGMTFAFIFIVVLLIVMFKGEGLNFVKLLTLVTHSFIIIALFTALQLPFIWQTPKVSYMIVGADFENITFRDATLIGIAPEGGMNITSPIIKVAYAKVYRAYPNLTLPDWNMIRPENTGEVVENTRTYMNLTGVRWLSGEAEFTSERLDLCMGNWSAVEYQDMLSRLPVRRQEAGFSEMMLDMLSMLSNVGLAAYNSIGFKRIYKASMKLTILVGALLFLLLFFFGGL
jgi:hypothetical protein